MILYRTTQGIFLEEDQTFIKLSDVDWDQLVNRGGLVRYLTWVVQTASDSQVDRGQIEESLLAPLVSQEVWAAGVTYRKSREARKEESEDAGGGDFYQRVYNAPRPELFMKATPHRVVGHGQKVRIRRDAVWSVPEPELTVLVSRRREIVGYTVGNDMSSRDIEGENPLYLPQAKVYSQSCALGPGILVRPSALPQETEISLEVKRKGKSVFRGLTHLGQMKRKIDELVDYLFRDNSFPSGCFLMTGTGVVPPRSFTLATGDEITIRIEGVGTLVNQVD